MSQDTTSTAKRHKYTNDALAVLLVASTVAAIAGSLYLTGSVPRSLLGVFAVESLLAATWAFGRETLAAVGEFRGANDQPVAVLREEAETGQQSDGSES
jgi:hypothetical protein